MTSAPPSLEIRRILLVDDEPLMRRVTQIALQRTTDWEITTACSGTEALALVRAGAIDLVLLDVMMPGLDGPGTLAQLRLIPSAARVPVIFFTAHPSFEPPCDLRLHGVAGVLSKPFDPSRLALQIQGLLGAAH